MSLIKLAEFIDDLVDRVPVAVTETLGHVIIHDVPTAVVRELVDLLIEPLDAYQIQDAGGNNHPLAGLDEGFSPFRISVEKPASSADSICFLTNTAFERLLQDEHPYHTIEVARLETRIVTIGCQYVPWGCGDATFVQGLGRDPNLVVRDLRRNNRLPDSLSIWMLVEPLPDVTPCAAYCIWTDAAVRRLIPALAEEISPDGTNLYFGLASRVVVDASRLSAESSGYLPHEQFLLLQAVVGWVFELPKQTSMRHALFGGELARIATYQQDVVALFAEGAGTTLDAAKIAYRLGLSELSSAALKLLTELRSEVADQISKSSDTTRQLVLSLAAAISVGIGLIAARVGESAPISTLMVLMAIASGYVALVGFIGWRFVESLQANRQHWRRHLYRFLPRKHYREMVVRPTDRSIRDYVIASVFSALSIVVLWGGLLLSAPVEGKRLAEGGPAQISAVGTEGMEADGMAEPISPSDNPQGHSPANDQGVADDDHDPPWPPVE